MVPTIVISNGTPETFAAYIGERAVDRLREGGKVILFDWDSHRGALAG